MTQGNALFRRAGGALATEAGWEMAEQGTILGVEDDEALRTMITFMLEDAGYPVRAVADGEAALAAVVEAMPALILLDLRMAGMDGWAFAGHFADRHGHAAPIVICTAAHDSARVAGSVGADAFLDKPFRLDDLLDTVGQFVPVPAPPPLPAQ